MASTATTTTATTTQLLEKADAALAARNTIEAERLYKEVLGTSSGAYSLFFFNRCYWRN